MTTADDSFAAASVVIGANARSRAIPRGASHARGKIAVLFGITHARHCRSHVYPSPARHSSSRVQLAMHSSPRGVPTQVPSHVASHADAQYPPIAVCPTKHSRPAAQGRSRVHAAPRADNAASIEGGFSAASVGAIGAETAGCAGGFEGPAPAQAAMNRGQTLTVRARPRDPAASQRVSLAVNLHP